MITNTVLYQAYAFAQNHKGFIADMDNKHIEVPFDKGVTEELVMEEGMLGRWFVDNGFSVKFEVKDVAYNTKGSWVNYSGAVRSDGHVAYLRNRLVAIVEW